jgi:hypothetical protein
MVAAQEARMASDGATRTIRWDDSGMKVSYANVCNVSTSREEVVLSFGMLAGANAQQASVAISDRLILNPATARQLAAMLEALVRDYEERFGQLPDPRSAA